MLLADSTSEGGERGGDEAGRRGMSEIDEEALRKCDEAHDHARLATYLPRFNILQGKNTRDEIEIFVREYIRKDAVEERARLLFGKKGKFLSSEILDLVDIAVPVALEHAERGYVDEYWIRRFGFAFLNILVMNQTDVLSNLLTVLKAQDNLFDRGITADGKGVTDKVFVLMFLWEVIRGDQRLPTKIEVRERMKSEGRTVKKSFYSELLNPIGLNGLP